MKRAAAAALAAIVLSGAAACHRGDKEIREGFTAAFDAPPALAVAPCPDADEKLARLQPLFQLAMRAYKAVKKFDELLPADLTADLMATPIEGLASDYRCFITDGSDRKLLMGTIANLYMRKGEVLLAKGDTTAGWSHVGEGLLVFSGPKPFEYLMYFSAGAFVRRARELVDHYRPSSEIGGLEFAAASGLLRRPDFCAGLKLEFLFQAYLPFFKVLGPLRPRVAARWGDRADSAMAAMAENNKPGDLELWRATTDLYTPLIAGCLDPHGPPLATLERAARAKLATLPRNSSVAQLAPYTLERLSQYGELEDEFLLFYVDLGRQRLRLATGMFDAREVEKRILVPSLPVPLVSSWDGSRASVENDPTTPGAVVLTRGRLRKVLPPLPPPLPRQYPNAP